MWRPLLYIIDEIKLYITQTTCIQTFRDNTVGSGQKIRPQMIKMVQTPNFS